MPKFGEKPPSQEESFQPAPEKMPEAVPMEGDMEHPFSKAEMAQVVSVQAEADSKQADAVLTKLQSMPKADLSEEDEAAINAEREGFMQEYQFRAEERNKNRKWYEKLFGKDEVTAADMVREEASKMNKQIDIIKEKSDLGNDAVASKLVERTEFGHKDRDTIQEEEMARKFAPDLVRALEEGDFVQAKKAGRQLFKGDVWKVYEDRSTQKLIDQRVETLILAGGMEKMRELVSVYSPDEIGPETLAKMPQEIIQLPKVQRQLSENISYAIQHFGNKEAIKEKIDQYVAFGWVTREQTDKILAGATEAAR